jgi:hypothetical protein
MPKLGEDLGSIGKKNMGGELGIVHVDIAAKKKHVK